MTRRRTLLLTLLLCALSVPNGAAEAACSSALPVSDKRLAHHSCDGVHPGMGLIVPSKKWGDYHCTAGFAFMDQYRTRYLTFPGDCYLDYECLEDTVKDALPPPLNELAPPLPTCLMPGESKEEPVFKRGGPAIRDLQGNRVATLVYAVNKDGVNFALARVDKGVLLDPKLPFYGGPVRTGAVSGTTEEAYAYSGASGLGTPNARSGPLLRFGPEFITHYTEGFTSIAPGTPVMKHDGTAVGYYNGQWVIALGWDVLPLGPAVQRASTKTKLKLKMMTAPLER